MNKVKIPIKAILRGFKRLWPFISIALKGMKKSRLKTKKSKPKIVDPKNLEKIKEGKTKQNG